MKAEVSVLLNQFTHVSQQPVHRSSRFAVIYRFFLKELRVWLGYGSLVLLNFLEIGLLVGTYYFLGSLVPKGVVDEYKTDFFTFALVGIAFQHFVYEIFFATDTNTSREQVWGTVESVMSTPIRPWQYAVGNYTCYYFYTWLYVFLTFALGKWLMGSEVLLTPSSLLSVFVISTLLVTAHLGLGLAAMGGILVSKAANPAATMFDWAQRLVCGVFFPVSALPHSLQIVSKFFPLTYALDALRRVLLAGEPLTAPEVTSDLLWLCVFTVILLPFGLATLAWGYNKARKHGTLGQY